jgi:hypothetical protein
VGKHESKPTCFNSAGKLAAQQRSRQPATRLPQSAVQPLNEPRTRTAAYFGGGGVKISRLSEGSGFGFGLGAFLISFLPLSLFPMHASMTQLPAQEKA